MIDLDGFRQYLTEEEMAGNTVTAYIGALRQYAAQYEDITKANLIAYKQEQLARHKPATVNLRIAAMLAYCRYARIPMRLKAVKMPVRTSIDNVITPEQLSALLRGVARDGNRAWYVNIKLLNTTGMRISEALRITKRDLMLGSVTMHTKDHMRTIYFPRSLLGDILGDIAGLSAGDLIVRGVRGKPYRSGDAFNRGLKSLADRYGIPREVMHPHSFRHYYALEFLRRKNDIALLADLLGHRSIDMTRIYLRQTQTRQQETVDKVVDW